MEIRAIFYGFSENKNYFIGIRLQFRVMVLNFIILIGFSKVGVKAVTKPGRQWVPHFTSSVS